MSVVLCFSLSATAQSSTTPRFSFSVLGHIRGKHDGKLHHQLDAIIAEVKALSPDFVVLTGDMIFGSYHDLVPDRDTIIRDWEHLDQALAGLEVPIYRVPGNHDLHDPVTRDVYFARYGPLPSAVEFDGCLFLFLNSAYVPEGDDPTPLDTVRAYTRGSPIDAGQSSFLANQLQITPRLRHVFLFMHHLLWWEDDSPWWKYVHSILTNRNVRAVFSGDWGPMKFSHIKRDGIHYIQSSIDDDVPLQILRDLESARLLDQQFDNFIHVTVEGDVVDIDVKTFSELTTDKFSPQRWRTIHHYLPPPDPLLTRVWDTIGTPRRFIAATVVMGTCFVAGIITSRVFARRRTP